MNIKTKLGKGILSLTIATALLGVTGSASASPDASTIGYGHTTSGAGVWCVQHSINYFLDNNGSAWRSSAPYWSLDEDSHWGAKTEAMVRWFQSRMNLEPDGVVGPATGHVILVYGQPYYNGTPWNGPGYCYWQVPSDSMYGG
ncbi:peptidoglycan-binding protein [Streptomyces sp. NPDC127038]|uniref:peptidoglycan-binding domain-containing protein n=1 Tax=Streptomyces sp. NPDC127038 TaxID=3347114 RepID=UPI0036607656